jgi:hypothetical protein
VQVVAASNARVSVTDPLGHVAHSVERLLGLNCPAAQAMHAIAPFAAPVLVTNPAEHGAHATVDALLYCPVVHAVHVVPRPAINVSVVEPAEHVWHCVAAGTEL